jgi:hypothetical protein
MYVAFIGYNGMAPGVSCFVRVGDKIHETGKSPLFTVSVILVGHSNELGDKKADSDTWLVGVTAGPVDRLPPRGCDQQGPEGRADMCYLQCSKRPSSCL